MIIRDVVIVITISINSYKMFIIFKSPELTHIIQKIYEI